MARGLVDIHCHVLPGLDDGPATLEDSLSMLQTARLDGIEMIVATPHAARCSAAQIVEAVGRLNDAAGERGIDVSVVPGSEIRLEADTLPKLQAGELLPLNGTQYVLLELPLISDWPPYLSQAIYDLHVAGYLPILAHTERYPPVQREPEILTDLISAGVVIQVNGDSIQGLAGQRARRTSHQLLQARMAHIIASDAHSLRTRPLRLRAALDVAGSLDGACPVQQYVERAARIVEGASLSLPDARPLPRRSWISRIAPFGRG